ncbi:uncharacterized protein BCR38DRAFT_482722 [Pseudomassariella vexata]|uniref:PH domain-containing protein n=1 Tax=Pseudomassariella vexata TaxID=1141098 RepID=A0A1Y2E690_9PEZI|nr:uncharacterized protein BCR38DRAFT_482722 [Pseudomassariella vexata]ORY67083.1 hypothetical protein BCR38DRAFT_482722 [Pseudomassariella vexata]
MAAKSPLHHPTATNSNISSILNNSSAFERAAPDPNPNLANAHAPASGNAGLSRNPSSGSNNYFHPYQQTQPQHSPQRTVVDDETLSNTVANSHLASPFAAGLQPPSRQPKFTEEWDASVRGSSIIDVPSMQRSSSISSRPEVLNTTTSDGAGSGNGGAGISLSRGNTLKKKSSLRKSGSLKRSSSRRSMKAGSVRSLALQSSHEIDEAHSAFYCPVPTTGNPTETLANRFQAWRKLLKDLIAYFREIQSHYEHRSKSLLKLANVLNNTSTPAGYLRSGGLNDALEILRNYHQTAIIEANKAREIEEDVILALTGLRSDLNQKMKEIKSLSGDFKNSVDKEMDNTRKAVNSLQEVLGQNELDSALTTGKQDPYLLRLAVDRQVERQIDEENYLHQAYLNLESSGRELESIVVGEIQKSYNAYAGILKRESDAAYNATDELRVGPIAMPKDHEWQSFIHRDAQFVDPEIPVRSAEHIHYPGRDHYASQEIRAGLLERKSKYLKSYTAGWYVLSPTHLHEFKSADKTQAPIMSLYLPEQKLGSHSTEGGSSNKFILKGRQTGSMHRGHTWVFRAESHDTMMAWYEDIKTLTEKSPEERSTFVRGHARTLSRSSQRSTSSDGMIDDEADEEPFVSNSHAAAVASPGSRNNSISSNRPQPGGRFPSDIQVNAQRGLEVAPVSPSSGSSGFLDNNEYPMRGANANGSSSYYEAIAAAGGLPGSGVGDPYPGNRSSQLVGQTYGNTPSVNMETAPSHAAIIHNAAKEDGVNPYSGMPLHRNSQHASDPTAVTGLGQQGPPQNDQLVYAQAPLITAVDFGATQRKDQPLPHQQQPQPLNAENGYAKGGEGAVHVQNGQWVRPVGGRTDSTPHIPGEYPRTTPVATPGTY